ncbi:MAG: carbohydrate kinase, partial [Rhizobiaceae bacterium]|nr:carbohydrate kinase [Rhizobiaceae bacterium]
GLPQTVRERTLGASYGDAFLAALAVGAVKKGDIAAWNPSAREIVPDDDSRAVYDRQYRIFKEIYSRTKDLMAELS